MFQIMQVISAPLIAITAFSIVKHGSISEAVVVGFGSGFASEPILLMIRSLVEKISPTQSAGSVAVKITPALSTPKPGEPIAFSAKVTGSSTNAVTWQIDPDDEKTCGKINLAGIYTAPNVVVAAQEITVTAISATDRNKSGTAVIKLAPAADTSPAPGRGVKVTPSTPTLKPGEQITFTAQVTGAPNTTVTWKLVPPEAATSGTITDAGVYTAPESVSGEKTVTVIARSTTDDATIGSATVKFAP